MTRPLILVLLLIATPAWADSWVVNGPSQESRQHFAFETPSGFTRITDDAPFFFHFGTLVPGLGFYLLPGETYPLAMGARNNAIPREDLAWDLVVRTTLVLPHDLTAEGAILVGPATLAGSYTTDYLTAQSQTFLVNDVGTVSFRILRHHIRDDSIFLYEPGTGAVVAQGTFSPVQTPEPHTWLLMVTGLLIGVLIRLHSRA